MLGTPRQLANRKDQKKANSKKHPFKSEGRDFPGGLVVKTPCFQCRGCRFDSWSGNKDPTCCTPQPEDLKKFFKRGREGKAQEESTYVLAELSTMPTQYPWESKTEEAKNPELFTHNLPTPRTPALDRLQNRNLSSVGNGFKYLKSS